MAKHQTIHQPFIHLQPLYKFQRGTPKKWSPEDEFPRYRPKNIGSMSAMSQTIGPPASTRRHLNLNAWPFKAPHPPATEQISTRRWCTMAAIDRPLLRKSEEEDGQTMANPC